MTDHDESPKEREERLRAEGKCSCPEERPLPTPDASMCAVCLVGDWDAHA